MIINVQIDYTQLLDRLDQQGISGYKLITYGIPHKTLYNIRNGKIITIETLAKLAYILDCNINDLVLFQYDIKENE